MTTAAVCSAIGNVPSFGCNSQSVTQAQFLSFLANTTLIPSATTSMLVRHAYHILSRAVQNATFPLPTSFNTTFLHHIIIPDHRVTYVTRALRSFCRSHRHSFNATLGPLSSTHLTILSSPHIATSTTHTLMRPRVFLSPYSTHKHTLVRPQVCLSPYSHNFSCSLCEGQLYHLLKLMGITATSMPTLSHMFLGRVSADLGLCGCCKNIRILIVYWLECFMF